MLISLKKKLLKTKRFKNVLMILQRKCRTNLKAI